MGQNFREKNYYEILEVPTTASYDEIHQGYMRAKNAYSQDNLALYSLMTQEECDSILEMINEAYSILISPEKREEYDKARGINTEFSYRRGGGGIERNQESTPTSAKESQQQATKQTTDNSSSQDVANIVAKRRFSLDYEVDDEFEKEIEQTTEFTGEFLQKIREYKQVDINRLADMTKVSKHYLRYIEEEDVKNLPAFVYIRGFVYQYAKCLKLNPEMVATSYIYRLKRLKGENS